MESAFWEQVVAGGHQVPDDHSLTDLTTELTTMLGSTDPGLRAGLAYPALSTWISEGVYDELLAGLGDGMAIGLAVGLGEKDTDTVFRRSFSVLVLVACLERDQAAHLVPGATVARWGDGISSWYIRERDLRAVVPGKGVAGALSHGADALRALAACEAMGGLELTVLLDVVGDRLLLATEVHLVHGEPDRLAHAVLEVLRRDLVNLDVLERWVARLALAEADGSTDAVTANVESFLRALHLQLALGSRPPACRADLLLVVIAQLKRLNADYLG